MGVSTVPVTEEDLDYDEETLQLDYEDLCNDVVELQNELKAAKIMKSQLQMRLKAVSTQCPTKVATVVPELPSVVEPTAPDVDPRLKDIEQYIKFMADHVMLDQGIIMDVCLEVPIGARTIILNTIVQWPLAASCGKRLFLSAPVECKDDLFNLFIAVKEAGTVHPATVESMAQIWDLVPGELETITQKAPEPVVALAAQTSAAGILVAAWPTPGALEAFRALCSVDGEPFQVQQRVEVEYEGKWFVGTLQSLTATGKASVCCDVDGPGVLTVAPVYRVRRHGVHPTRSARAHSDMGPSPVYAEPEEPPVQPSLRRSQSEGDLPTAPSQ